MAQSLTPAQLGVIQTLQSAARGMILELASTGSGSFTESVLRYQRLWNESATLINEVTDGRWFGLVEDGMYGPNTSLATAMAVPPGVTSPPPRYARQMPTWYAENRDIIDAMAPMQTVPVDEILDPWNGAPTYDAAATVDEARSGSLATEVTSSPDAIGPSATSPEIQAYQVPKTDMWCDQFPDPERRECFNLRYDIVDPDGGECVELSYDDGSGMVFDAVCDKPGIAYGDQNVQPIPEEYHAPATEIVAAPPSDAIPAQPLPELNQPAPIMAEPMPMAQLVEFTEDVPVLAAPTRGRVPFIALAIGAVALGGTLVYFTRRTA